MILAMLLILQDAGEATKPRPATYPGSWVTDDDYPAAAIWERQAGTVGAQLDLSAEGVPTGCIVTASSGSAALDKTTCELMRARARFYPARNAAGSPVSSSYKFQFTWVLPDGPSQFGSWAYFSQIRILNGRIAGCSARSNGVGFSRPAGPCSRMGGPVPPAMTALIGTASGNATVTAVETHVVVGEASPQMQRPAAKPFYERKIRFDVDAAGNVANCKVTGPVAQDPLGYVVHRCHSGLRYPPLARGKRSVEMTVSLYLSRDPAPPPDPAEGPTV